MNNEKYGIITMYHNSINYGGVLQAYALHKFLGINTDTEIITYKKIKKILKQDKE